MKSRAIAIEEAAAAGTPITFAIVTRVHELHHPGTLLRRSPAGLGDAERAALPRADGDNPAVRDLLRLAHVMATRL